MTLIIVAFSIAILVVIFFFIFSLFNSLTKKIDDLECHLRDTQRIINVAVRDFESVGTTINMKINNSLIPMMKFEARIIELNNILKDEQKSDNAGPNAVA